MLKKSLSGCKLTLPVLIFLSIFLIFSAGVNPALASDNRDKIVVIVLTDYVSIDELGQVKESKYLEQNYDGAIVSFRSGSPIGSTDLLSVYASMNTGDRAYIPSTFRPKIGMAEEPYFEESNLSFLEAYRRLNGRTPSVGVVYPEVNIIESYQKSQNSVEIGLFGDLLEKYEIKRFVYGNGDFKPFEQERTFCIFLADSKGQIGNGDVGAALVKESSYLPGGIEANYEKLFKSVKKTVEDLVESKKSGIIVVYPGDIFRLEAFSQSMDPEVYRELKKHYLAKYIDFLEKVSLVLTEKDLLVFASISPSAADLKLGSVTGFMFVKGDRFKGGSLLYSGTTKQAGCLFLNDFTATIAEFLNITDPELKGNIAMPAEKTLSIEKLSELNNRFLNIDRLRAPVLKTYVFVIVITLFLSVINLLISLKPLFLRMAKFFIYVSVLSPVFMFILGPFGGISPIFTVFLILLLSILVSYLLLRSNMRSPIVIALILVVFTLLIAVDAPFSTLNRFSYLGYSFNTGARFYGIGNEHMGIFAAGIFLIISLVGTETSRFRSKFVKNKSWVRFLLFLITAAGLLWMLLPFLGANVGGGIAVLVGAGFTAYHALKRKFDEKIFVWLLIGIVSLLGLFAAISVLFPSFHLSKFVKSIAASNYDSAVWVILRKVRLNLKLLWFTVWNKYLIALLISLAVIITNPGGVLARFLKKDAWVESLLAGTAFGAIAAFIFNDSGVVAAATMLIYPAMIFISELLELKSNGEA